jgi:nucleotide-binding universal stress UspA family protein
MSSRELRPADTIDGFRLESQLPSGGLAQFWRVSRSGMTLPAIMKIPLLRRGENPLTIVGFEVEQMILPRLTGPHVPQFIAAGDFDGPYIVMELIAGSTLKARLDSLPLACAEVADIGAKIAAALHDIHRQHVLHLDLKPSNIMLPAERAVLIDFGLSRHLQLPDLPAQEFDGPIGTGAYISPEQVAGTRDDPRSDLFALGVVMYFLATDERPFGDPGSSREWRRRLYYDAIPPRRRRADIPEWLQEIILHCLEIDPNARYQTAAQVAFDLQHPEQVALTDRAFRQHRNGTVTAALRWLDRLRLSTPAHTLAAGQHAQAPIILAAVDLTHPGDLAQAIRVETGRLLASAPAARLACLNILKLSRVALDETEDAEGRNLHLQRLAELKHWGIGIAADNTTYHVLEAADPASAIIDFARRNHVDHVILGARGSSLIRRYLGSVSTRVVAETPCTVTVVRAPSEPQ